MVSPPDKRVSPHLQTGAHRTLEGDSVQALSVSGKDMIVDEKRCLPLNESNGKIIAFSPSNANSPGNKCANGFASISSSWANVARYNGEKMRKKMKSKTRRSPNKLKV